MTKAIGANLGSEAPGAAPGIPQPKVGSGSHNYLLSYINNSY